MAEKDDIIRKLDMEIEAYIEASKNEPSGSRMKKLEYYTALRNELDIMPMNEPLIAALADYDGYLACADKLLTAYAKTADNETDYTELSFRFVSNIYSETRMNKLYDRMNSEHEAFKEKLLKMSPKEVYSKAYEICMKDDILMLLENDAFSYRKIDTLLSFEYPLDAIYQEWLDTDSSHMDMLLDSMNNLVEKQDRYLQNQSGAVDNVSLPDDIAVWNAMYDGDEERFPESEENEDGEDMEL